MDAAAVYRMAMMIPKGRVSTYGAIARAVGRPRAARAVGAIMRANPNPPTIPCHRVVYSDGRLGGFGGRFNVAKKAELLRSEGIRIVHGSVQDFQHVLYQFKARMTSK